METEYRIVKEYYRDDSTGEVVPRFYPEYSYISFWRKKKRWTNCTETHSYPGAGSWRTVVSFKDEAAAIKFVDLMRKPVPDREVVDLNSEKISTELPETREETREVFPRSSLRGFSEKQMDEIALGKSFKRMEAFREYIFKQVTAAVSVEAQREALIGLIGKALDKLEHEEAINRKL